jgi:hypothetical protein
MAQGEYVATCRCSCSCLWLTKFKERKYLQLRMILSVLAPYRELVHWSRRFHH